ncbi:hypothetical protein OIE99_30175 [Streptomyces cellulosae]|nr:hypothetical protein OIE99_30175 [Streptomyces cellulosae]
MTATAGSVEVTAPRVNDKRVDAATCERMRFCEGWFQNAVVENWRPRTGDAGH